LHDPRQLGTTVRLVAAAPKLHDGVERQQMAVVRAGEHAAPLGGADDIDPLGVPAELTRFVRQAWDELAPHAHQ
jgi:hypothetical protein